MSDRPHILVSRPVSQATAAALGRLAPVAVVPFLSDPATVADGFLGEVRVVVTGVTAGLSPAMVEACPKLGLVHFIGAGYDGFDLDLARRRGIRVTTGRGANADSVADHALMLLLAALRRLPVHDREVRGGVWNQKQTTPQLAGKRVGILGLGEIGGRIARRLTGFDVEVHYTGRAPKPDVPWIWQQDTLALAAAVDHLIVASPGTPETHHLVDGAALRALGPQGVVVNIGRGSVIDTAALAAALADGTVAGAGLDVVEGEPAVPTALIGFDNVVLTPHIAAMSPEADQAMTDRALACAAAFLAGEPLAGAVL